MHKNVQIKDCKFDNFVQNVDFLNKKYLHLTLKPSNDIIQMCVNTNKP